MPEHLFDHQSWQNEHNALLTAWKDAAAKADALEAADPRRLNVATKDAITAAKHAYANFMANLG